MLRVARPARAAHARRVLDLAADPVPRTLRDVDLASEQVSGPRVESHPRGERFASARSVRSIFSRARW